MGQDSFISLLQSVAQCSRYDTPFLYTFSAAGLRCWKQLALISRADWLTDIATYRYRKGKANLASVTYRKGKDFGKGVRMRSRAEIVIFFSDSVFLSVPISVRTRLNSLNNHLLFNHLLPCLPSRSAGSPVRPHWNPAPTGGDEWRAEQPDAGGVMSRGQSHCNTI